MITVNPVMGVGLHGVGALFAASCYTPQKKTKLWAWEIYWISQATFAWLILPILGAVLIVPDYFGLLADCQSEVMLKSFGLGVVYGTGGLAFGLAIRHVGFSLTYSIAIGISAILGTIMPLFWTPNDGFVYKFDTLFNSGPGLIVFAGIALAVSGIFICGYAGVLRERSGNSSAESFSFNRGVPLAIVAGILSAVFNFALLAGEPLAKAAVENGATELLSWNAIYPFSHGGAWLTNLLWCVWLIRRNGTAEQFVRLPSEAHGGLPIYYLMAFLSGAFWYFQFFFYGMGHLNLGDKFGFTSWAIHMSLLILFSNIYGKLFREWEGSSAVPRKVVHYGMLVIVIATLIITYGNYKGEKQRTPDVDDTVKSQQTTEQNLYFGRHTMKRYGSIIGLRTDKIDEYKKLHAAVWPEVLDMIKQCNIQNYSIYLRRLPGGKYYLFSYFEYVGEDFEADMAKMAADSVTQKWWSVCKPCQEPLPDITEGQWWADMEEVFHYD